LAVAAILKDSAIRLEKSEGNFRGTRIAHTDEFIDIQSQLTLYRTVTQYGEYVR
jgi:hypothetical protein